MLYMQLNAMILLVLLLVQTTSRWLPFLLLPLSTIKMFEISSQVTHAHTHTKALLVAYQSYIPFWSHLISTLPLCNPRSHQPDRVLLGDPALLLTSVTLPPSIWKAPHTYSSLLLLTKTSTVTPSKPPCLPPQPRNKTTISTPPLFSS